MVLALPYTAQQPRRTSPITPLKPDLPDDPLAKGEKLIKLPNFLAKQKDRNRRESESLPPLTEEQKILHFLNRAGFGPRPGDVQRVRQMGLERYLEEQLHPEEIPDDFIAQPLLAFNTLQMTIPETLQSFAPPPARAATPAPAPTPPAATPTPTPASGPVPIPAIKPMLVIGDDNDPENDSGRNGRRGHNNRGELMTVQNPSMPAPQQPESMPAPAPTPAPTPASRRDPQQPLRELQQTKLLRAIFSEKQLSEVMVDFWFNHFNVYAGKDQIRWSVTTYERDAIRPHALGKFKDLLVAVAQSPAMLHYLDNYLSQAEPPVKNRPAPGNSETSATPAPATRRPGLNENYARELMELHTLGVDGGYTQQDVIELARCFTGWTVTPAPNAAFIFRPKMHDRGEKTVLGTKIAAGGGIEDGLRMLELLAAHPSTARFVSRKLCQRFVADAPPESLVNRAAEIFKQTNGEIREVVRAILTSPEFYAPAYYRDKIKSPLELAASAIRATGATTDAAQPLIQWVTRMGEPFYLCQPPTGYSEESIQWLSNATLLERMNFALALVNNKIGGTRVEVSRLVTSDAGRNRDKLLDQLIAVIVHSNVSEETRDNLERVVNESRNKLIPAKHDERAAKRNDEQLIGGVAALILGSREFQVK
ncbi:MAG TPA: DUF1800 domain-containing protein [Blastocatellia bacterium]|nr:DUF1800 domain-containing protein [Blastocatellia bacterium]